MPAASPAKTRRNFSQVESSAGSNGWAELPGPADRAVLRPAEEGHAQRGEQERGGQRHHRQAAPAIGAEARREVGQGFNESDGCDQGAEGHGDAERERGLPGAPAELPTDGEQHEADRGVRRHAAGMRGADGTRRLGKQPLIEAGIPREGVFGQGEQPDRAGE
jgi:hypothetical protein